MEIASIHFYVYDAIALSNWFRQKLGFQLVDRYQASNFLSIAVAYQNILLIISAPCQQQGKVAAYLAQHPEGVSQIDFWLDNLDQTIEQAQKHQVKIVLPIQKQTQVRYARLQGWGSLQHTLLAKSTNQATSGYYVLPNGKLRKFSSGASITLDPARGKHFSWQKIDHLVLNVAKGELAPAVSYYQNLFGWQVRQTFNIATKHSGLYSQALSDRTRNIQFNINEPTTKNSQIQEFIDLNHGAGIQHLALATNNLIQDVETLRQHQIEFLTVPAVYYAQLRIRLRNQDISIREKDLQSIAKQQILVDWNQNNLASVLMQIFTKPVLAKPTFFLEFIQRQPQALGFGEGNFKALFQAVEKAQLIKNLV